MKRILLLVSLMTVNMAVFAFNATQMVTDARSQIGKTLYYDPAYTALRYQSRVFVPTW